MASPFILFLNNLLKHMSCQGFRMEVVVIYLLFTYYCDGEGETFGRGQGEALLELKGQEKRKC